MKKFIYISSIVLVNIFVIGTVCKLLHFPGASLFILIGIVFFVTVLLPLALLNNYRNNAKEKQTLYIAAYLTTTLFLVAALFELFHWPGFSYLIMIAIPLPFVLFLPVFLYHNRKHEPKQSLNFIGVILLLVYMAVFISLLGLNISKNVIDGITISANDFSTFSQIYEQKNTAKYESLNKMDSSVAPTAITGLKKRSEEICNKIEAVKAELVKSIDGEDSQAIDANGHVDINKVINRTESNTSAFIMHMKNNNGGEASVLKKMLEEYRSFLISLTSKHELQQLINSMLNTEDKPSVVNPGETDTWEYRFFPQNASLMAILGNLSMVQTNVRVAESFVLAQH